MRHSIFILLALLLTGSFSEVRAQIGAVETTDVVFQIIPEVPGPNEVVTINATSYVTNIDFATFTWRMNGRVVLSGKGEKVLTFTTGNIGSPTTINVSVQTAEGSSFNETLRIVPGRVDIVWEAETYTPPFYKGKALFTHQSRIKFIAIPHIAGTNGGEISPRNLSYKWTRNGQVIEGSSGFGKDTFIMTGSIISRPLEIEVEVSSGGSGNGGYASLTVFPGEPSVLMYKKNPLYGIEFQKAFTGSVDLTDSKEIDVFGVPFFFGVTNPLSLTYEWAINGSLIDGSDKNIKSFRHIEGTSGSSNISLSIKNENKILQFASKTFRISFSEE